VTQNPRFNDVTRAPAFDSWLGQKFCSCHEIHADHASVAMAGDCGCGACTC